MRLGYASVAEKSPQAAAGQRPGTTPAAATHSTTREKRALGDAFGLTKIGVNLSRLMPGKESSMRHWHTHEDELVYVLEGELVTELKDLGPPDLGGERTGDDAPPAARHRR